MAVRVAGLDSWIHHSRVKGWNSPVTIASLSVDPESEPVSFSHKPLDGLKLLFKKKMPTDTDKSSLSKLPIPPIQSIHSVCSYFGNGTTHYSSF
jgi:hypothetical protein